MFVVVSTLKDTESGWTNDNVMRKSDAEFWAWWGTFAQNFDAMPDGEIVERSGLRFVGTFGLNGALELTVEATHVDESEVDVESEVLRAELDGNGIEDAGSTIENERWARSQGIEL